MEAPSKQLYSHEPTAGLHAAEVGIYGTVSSDSAVSGMPTGQAVSVPDRY